MDDIFLLLGSNLGDRPRHLREATALLLDFFLITNQSSIYESDPWGVEDQPVFLNQVLKGKSELSATELLQAVLSVEKQMGRERRLKWGERIIDIDILYYHHQNVNTPDLIVPHPQIHNRRFTLVPLCEIAPGYQHPIFQKPLPLPSHLITAQ